MKLLLAGLGALAITGLVSQPIYADHSKRSKYKNHSYSHKKSKRHHKRHWRSRRDSYEAIIANDLDPSGTYSGYPDWARIALSPKFTGRN